MKRQNILSLAVASLLSLTLLAGCTDNTPGESSTPDSASSDAAAFTGAITVLSREDGSGTRGAFIELFGIEVQDADGNKIDETVETAEIVSSTSTMATSVAGNKKAIGYVSLGALSSEVKALTIDGVTPSVEGVKDGSYKISRPFNIATKGEPTGIAADFIAYIMSPDGQKVVEDKGYISEGAGEAYTPSNQSGTLDISGSTSVYPVMEKLVEAYRALNPNATVNLQQSDSTTGMTDTINGTLQIGMASRELKDSEIESGLISRAIALDGIAVIVNQENPVNNLTSEQVRQVFTGALTDWSDVQ